MINEKIKREVQEYKGVLIFALGVALVAGIFTWQKQEKYEVSLSLNISRSDAQSAQDYKYDNYYALMASDEFGNTVAGWFKMPEMTQAILKRADLWAGAQSLDSLKKRFKAAKISPNSVEIRFSAQDESAAKNLAEAVVAIVSDKTGLLGSSSSRGIAFAVTGSEPVIVENHSVIWWNMLAGILVGLVVGFFVKVSREYFSVSKLNGK